MPSHSLLRARGLALALPSAVLLVLAPLAIPTAQAAPSAATSASPGRLYVQAAERATVTRSASGTATLTLHGVHARTRWFTDRPARQAGSQSTSTFVRQWGMNGFAAVAPNAVIEWGGASLPVTLRSPRYDAGREALSYAITPIGASKRPLPRTMGEVALFIDDSGTLQQQVVFSVSGLTPGMQFAITLASSGNAVTFTGGSSISAEPSVPLLNSAVSSNAVAVYTAPSTGVQSATMTISLTLTANSGPMPFTLQANAAPGVMVSAQVGPTAPVMLSQAPTTLAWAD